MYEDLDYELYVHIPFCVKKCNYCDFLSFPADENTKQEYVNKLIEQIEHEASDIRNKNPKGKVRSIYFGGGTPSVLKVSQLAMIVEALYNAFDVSADSENTIEVNPGTVDYKALQGLRKAGFNRISIGMQSADANELHVLGRIHSYEQFEECYMNARKAGFTNVNVDVMLALPGQDEDALLRNLNALLRLSPRPEHISAYSLIVEEGTPFYEQYGDIEGPVVGQEIERTLYWKCNDVLLEKGYSHYEISNYSIPGFESRHNSGYWKRIMYVGFGLGAASLIRDCSSINNVKEYRIRNTSSLEEYLSDPLLKEEYIELSSDEAMDEYMFLGLRMAEGIDAYSFCKRYGVEPYDIYSKTINKYCKEGLLIFDDMRVCLSKEGVDYGNYVFAGFLRE